MNAARHAVHVREGRLGPVLLALVLFAGAVSAQPILVPADHAQLQDAIDAAQPGDVIAITGGVFDGIEIDKPLTLVGSASQRPEVRFGVQGSELTYAVHLSTPGSVTLAGLDIGGDVNGAAWPNHPDAIFGEVGELRLLHCTVRTDSVFVSGHVPGATGINLDCVRLLVVDSTVTGGNANFDGIFDGAPWSSGPAITVSGDVIALDSTIRGADGPLVQVGFTDWTCAEAGGSAGAAILAASVRSADSVLASGAPGHAWVWNGVPSGVPDEECDLPTPDSVTADSVTTWPAGTLTLSPGGLLGGGSLTVSVEALGAALFLTGTPTLSPPPFGPTQELYLQPATLTVTPFVADTPVTRELPIGPQPPGAWGGVLGFQVYDFDGGLTRPAFTAVLAP